MQGSFFPQLSERFNALPDGRVQDCVDYSVASLLWASILMFACRLKSRRAMQFIFDSLNLTRYLKKLSRDEDVVKCPHGDTIADYLDNLPVEELAEICPEMVGELIEKRKLEDARLMGMYYPIAIDGTGWLNLGDAASDFTEGCLTRKLSNGKTQYYRPVVEAKLVCSQGLVFSVGTAFTENVPRQDEGDEKYKQKCERSSIKTLLPLIRRRFSRLNMVVLTDALHANEPIFQFCEDLDFRFIIVLKEGSIPSVYKEFYSLVDVDTNNRLSLETRTVRKDLRWVDGIAYNKRTLNLLECVETDKKTGEITKWLWVTDIPLDSKTAPEVEKGGRLRWKIENEGNNVQKNGFEMEHAYAKRTKAAKNFYLLLQIAHLLIQMFECRLGGKQNVVKKHGSAAALALLLLESFRNHLLPENEELDKFLETKIQVRIPKAFSDPTDSS